MKDGWETEYHPALVRHRAPDLAVTPRIKERARVQVCEIAPFKDLRPWIAARAWTRRALQPASRLQSPVRHRIGWRSVGFTAKGFYEQQEPTGGLRDRLRAPRRRP